MRTLYHLPLSAASRTVRLALTEKGLDFQLRAERVWERREDFLALNPAGEVPVLVDEDGTAVATVTAIVEYLEEVYPDPCLLAETPSQRAEVRRLVDWFESKFDREVTRNLVGEKVMKRFLVRAEPNTSAIRAGLANIGTHLQYIGFLTDRRRWLAGDSLTYADLSAAAHISTLDYIGDVPWSSHDDAKQWYARIKSRPSFRALLKDHIAGLPPPRHYADLDF